MKPLLTWLCIIGVTTTSQSATIESPLQPHLYDDALDSGARGQYPTKTFLTSKIQAPRINYASWSPSCDDGLLTFITPKGWKVSNPGPMILDAHGEVVWSQHFGNKFGGQTYNLQVQSYRDEDYLTFWSGDDRIVGHGFGHFYMLNSSYDVVHKIGAAGGRPADLHEFRITPQGTALVVVYEIVVGDTTPLGRKLSDWLFSLSYVWDSIIQEIDIETGELVFEWRASEHVNITNTYRDMGETGTQADPFDWFHVNSVEKDEHSNYLISVRYTHALYYIHGNSKEIIWTLGGRSNSFMDLSDGHALNFAWQHDARFHPTTTFPETYTSRKPPNGLTTILVTLFDNSGEDWNYAYGPPFSRGMLLELTYPSSEVGHSSCDSVSIDTTKINRYKAPERQLSPQDTEKISDINRTKSACTAQVIQEYIDPQPVRSSSQGSLQLIPGGRGRDPRVLVGFGLCAVVTEFASDGTVHCEMHYGANTSWEKGDVQSYRAQKFHWIGNPGTLPAIVVKGGVLYVSWNGATEVREWQVQVRDDVGADEWKDSALSHKTGFETAIAIPEEHGTGRFVRVLALDSTGKLLPHGVGETFDRGWYDTLLRQQLGSPHITSVRMTVGVATYVALGLVGYLLYRCCRGLVRKLGSRSGKITASSKRA